MMWDNPFDSIAITIDQHMHDVKDQSIVVSEQIISCVKGKKEFSREEILYGGEGPIEVLNYMSSKKKVFYW